MKTKPILIEKIEWDESSQARVSLDENAMQEYAEAWDRGAKFPPIVTFFDGSDYWLGDGFHRVHVARKRGEKLIEAEVHKGGREDAAWYATGANTSHGVRRTNADKRKAVEMALRLKPEMSDRAIAEHCGVGHPTVAAVRESLTGKVFQSNAETKRVGRDGRTIDTAKIGRTAQERPEASEGRTAASEAGASPEPAYVGLRARAEAKEAEARSKDETGFEIPEDMRQDWHDDRATVQAWLGMLRAFAKPIQEVHDGGEDLTKQLNRSKFDAIVDTLRGMLGDMVRPHAVCPYCGGEGGSCRPCLERGWMTASQWSQVPKDVRGGRE